MGLEITITFSFFSKFYSTYFIPSLVIKNNFTKFEYDREVLRLLILEKLLKTSKKNVKISIGKTQEKNEDRSIYLKDLMHFYIKQLYRVLKLNLKNRNMFKLNDVFYSLAEFQFRSKNNKQYFKRNSGLNVFSLKKGIEFYEIIMRLLNLFLRSPCLGCIIYVLPKRASLFSLNKPHLFLAT